MIDIAVNFGTASKLNTASANKRFYPFDKKVIDWTIPITDEYLYIPENVTFLAGTTIWDRLTERERSYVTRWEITQIFRYAGTGEHALSQGILAMLWRADQYNPGWRYLLHEVAEECQHMAMFNEWVRHNEDIYTTGIGTQYWGTAFSVFSQLLALNIPELFWVMVLLFEVIGDDMFVVMKENPTGKIHPILQQIGHLHVAEEARHIHFARDWMRESMPRLSRGKRLIVQSVTKQIVLKVLSMRNITLLTYTDQLKPYMSQKEFNAAIASKSVTNFVSKHIYRVLKVLEESGALRDKDLQKWIDHGKVIAF